MLFNSVINVMDIDVEIPEGTQHIEMSLITAITVPVGPGEVGVIPAGKLRVPLTDREVVEKLGDELKNLAQHLPKASNIETASNMSDVEAAAERLERIKQGGPSHRQS